MDYSSDPGKRFGVACQTLGLGHPSDLGMDHPLDPGKRFGVACQTLGLGHPADLGMGHPADLGMGHPSDPVNWSNVRSSLCLSIVRCEVRVLPGKLFVVLFLFLFLFLLASRNWQRKMKVNN